MSTVASSAVNPFLSIILSLISLPATVHRLVIEPPLGEFNLGRFSTHNVSHSVSSGRPQRNPFLSVARLTLAVDVPESNDSGVTF